MSFADLLPLVVVALATSAASVTDLWMFKIYNVLTIPMLLAGICASTVLGGWAGLGTSLLGAGLGFGLLVVFFALGGVGPGDVKLLTAVGAWLGPFLTFHVFIGLAIFGGIYAVALVIIQKGMLGLAAELASARGLLLDPGSWNRPTSTIEAEVRRPDRRRRLVPYAAMTSLGFFATIAWWGSDLQRVWPPYKRDAAVSTASTTSPRIDLDWGGAR